MFEHKVEESTERTKRREQWTAKIGEYDVMLTRDENDTRLNIYRYRSDGHGLRLGIIECRPRSVGDLRAFAEDAAHLFAGIAKGLAAAGLDDLRDSWERIRDDHEARVAEMGRRMSEDRK